MQRATTWLARELNSQAVAACSQPLATCRLSGNGDADDGKGAIDDGLSIFL